MFWKNSSIFILGLILQYPVTCYQNHTALSSIVFTNIEPPDENVQNEYFYGKCATMSKTLLATDSWKYEELKGKMIVRSWLDVLNEPTCVYLNSKSNYGDQIKYHAFKFNVCICRLVYNYGGQKYTYYYYEWFIPVETMKDIEWTLYFYLS